jgi:hypothetical protein
MTDGVTLAATADGKHLAWVGVEVAAAVDLTRLSGYAELPEPDRLWQAHRADTEYLGRLCQQPGTVLDHRWLAGGPGGPELSVLARVGAGSAQQARAAALALRERLADLPDHVTGGQVTDTDRLLDLLHPFDPVPAGIAEICRVPITEQPRRPDAHTSRYLAVQPCGWHPGRWDPVLRALSDQPGRTVLSVGLQSWRVPAALLDGLRAETGQYQRLAQPTAVHGASLVGTTWLEGERFAQFAAPLYAEAARRYQEPVFRVRITLAGTCPLGRDLVSAVLAAVATADPAGLRATAPAGPDLDATVRLLRGLGVPPPSPDAARLLVTIADPAEAAACCRLPAASTGRLFGTPVAPPPPHRHAGGIRIQGDWVCGDKTGGDTILEGGKHVYFTTPPATPAPEWPPL